MGTIEFCRLCGRWYDLDDETGHPECDDEYSGRVDSRTCVYCGEGEAAGGNDWCSKCDALDDPQYVGYPGGV